MCLNWDRDLLMNKRAYIWAYIFFVAHVIFVPDLKRSRPGRPPRFSNPWLYAPTLSKVSFSSKPLLLTSTLYSDWPTDPVHCDWPNTTSTRWKCNDPYHNHDTSFNFQVSFTIISSLKGEQSRVTDTVMMLVCICSTQATVKTISDGL